MKINREKYVFPLKKTPKHNKNQTTNNKKTGLCSALLALLIYFTMFTVALARDYTRSVSPLKETIKRTRNDLHYFSTNVLQWLRAGLQILGEKIIKLN